MSDGEQQHPAEGFTRPFADVLMDLGKKGSTHTELSEGLKELCAAVRDNGKGGSLTLTIKVNPLDKKNSEILTFTDTVTVKVPEKDRKKTVFFPDNEGNPLRDNPNQMQFEGLRDVSEPREPDAAERAAGEAVSE